MKLAMGLVEDLKAMPMEVLEAMLVGEPVMGLVR